jgi:hypothetical protein
MSKLRRGLYRYKGDSDAADVRYRFARRHPSRISVAGVEVPWQRPDLSRWQRVEALLEDLTILARYSGPRCLAIWVSLSSRELDGAAGDTA